MPIITYKLKISVTSEVFDAGEVTVYNVSAVKFQGPTTGASYVSLPHRDNVIATSGQGAAGNEALLSEKLAGAGFGMGDRDQLWARTVMPIEVFTKNPSCVRVGGWLFCP